MKQLEINNAKALSVAYGMRYHDQKNRDMITDGTAFCLSVREWVTTMREIYFEKNQNRGEMG